MHHPHVGTQRRLLGSQHGWNKIYMGKAGWIPIDTTRGEADYVDSGHIRIGIHQSTATALNARNMEILDYRIGSGSPSESKPPAPAKYDKYLGEYAHSSRGKVQVMVKGGCRVSVPMAELGGLRFSLDDSAEV